MYTQSPEKGSHFCGLLLLLNVKNFWQLGVRCKHSSLSLDEYRRMEVKTCMYIDWTLFILILRFFVHTFVYYQLDLMDS